jgi:hypothetical protein
MLDFKALVTSQLQRRDTEIRFCSVSQSGFEPSLSGFVPAPTGETPELIRDVIPASEGFTETD